MSDAPHQTRGFGAARKPANKAPVDRFCISPQLAPPYSDKRSQKAMAASEDYHAGRGYGSSERK